MRQVILQAIWEPRTVVLEKVGVSEPFHSSVRVFTPSINYEIFESATSEVAFSLCVRG